MKPFYLLLLLTVSCTYTIAQTPFPELAFKSAPDYKAQEQKVKAMADYIFTSPASENDENRKIAFRNITNWMNGTPDYKFIIDESLSKMIKNNPEVLGVYLAAMTQWVLENKKLAGDQKAMKLNSFTRMLNYCEKKENMMKVNKEVKKAIEAKNNGTLGQFLNL